MTSNTPPQSILLSVGDSMQQSLIDDLYKPLISKITTAYPSTLHLKSSSKALQTIQRTTPPPTILAIDGGLTNPHLTNLHSRLSHYIREDGGTLILCMLFSSFVRPSDLNAMFSTLGLPWEQGDYHRSTFSLSLRASSIDDMFGEHAQGLEREYSMKAVHLKGVPAAAKVYVPKPDSRIESMVFPPDAVDQGECPAVFARVGKGRVGFVGDVNNEGGVRR